MSVEKREIMLHLDFLNSNMKVVKIRYQKGSAMHSAIVLCIVLCIQVLDTNLGTINFNIFNERRHDVPFLEGTQINIHIHLVL